MALGARIAEYQFITVELRLCERHSNIFVYCCARSSQLLIKHQTEHKIKSIKIDQLNKNTVEVHAVVAAKI